jgi:uncharacterized low-complexity protein
VESTAANHAQFSTTIYKTKTGESDATTAVDGSVGDDCGSGRRINVKGNSARGSCVVDKQLPALLTTSKGIHTAPELSHREAQISALLADEMRKTGYMSAWASVRCGLF